MRARENGFSLVELLVAMCIMVGVTAAVFAVLDPSGPAFVAHGESLDVQQRLRVVTESLTRDLRMSGAGASPRGRVEPLTRVLAAVRPSGSDADGIRLTFVPPDSAQAVTATAMPARSGTVVVAGGPVCTTGNSPCGFTARTRVLVYDAAGFHDVFTVTGVSGSLLHLRHDLPDSAHLYMAGSAIVEVVDRAYALRRDPATGVDQLVRDDGESAVPVADHVVGLSFEYFGEAEPPRVLGTPSAGGSPQTTYGPRPPAADVSAGSFGPGENCVFRFAGGYVARLPRLGSSGSLVSLTAGQLTDGPWCPDPFHPGRFDADLLRVRRVVGRVRVQAAIESLRGPAGPLFRHGGTARTFARVVPDLEATMDVAPGNLRAFD